jgi:hypothetical protein
MLARAFLVNLPSRTCMPIERATSSDRFTQSETPRGLRTGRREAPVV